MDQSTRNAWARDYMALAVTAGDGMETAQVEHAVACRDAGLTPAEALASVTAPSVWVGWAGPFTLQDARRFAAVAPDGCAPYLTDADGDYLATLPA